LAVNEAWKPKLPTGSQENPSAMGQDTLIARTTVLLSEAKAAGKQLSFEDALCAADLEARGKKN
jgi:hypothetical protein